jgi:hypothetical protein
MDTSAVIDVLNRLLRILCRGLPMYLEEAKPWICRDDEETEVALDNLVADRRVLAEQVAAAIIEQGGRPDSGRFPSEFAVINDLSLGFLRGKLLEHQRRDVEAIRQCAAELSPTPIIRAIAEEALGNAQGHAEILEEIERGWPAPIDTQ